MGYVGVENQSSLLLPAVIPLFYSCDADSKQYNLNPRVGK